MMPRVATGDRGFVTDDVVLRTALAEHYVAHGLPANGGADDQWFRVRIGPVASRVDPVRAMTVRT
jgi:hypothetical protein